jgi:hypothetical protein
MAEIMENYKPVRKEMQLKSREIFLKALTVTILTTVMWRRKADAWPEWSISLEISMIYAGRGARI